jgi:Leucine-rich repeat (LRR) protein
MANEPIDPLDLLSEPPAIPINPLDIIKPLVIDEAFIDEVKRDGGKDLNFRGMEYADIKLRDDHVIDIVNNHFKADEITVIDLTSCKAITNATLNHISTMCTNLEQLFLSDCHQITDDGIQAIVRKIGYNMKVLDYSECFRCTDAAFQAVVQHCLNLKQLYANNTGIKLIPDSIGEKLPKLWRLNLRDNDIKIIPDSFALLALKAIDLSGNPFRDPRPEIVEQGIEAITMHILQRPFTHQNKTGGVNDAAAQDPDRLGYRTFAEAISTITRQAEAPNIPVCGATYARWGSGKTTLEKLRKQDRNAWTKTQLDERLKELEGRKEEEEQNGQWWSKLLKTLQSWICTFWSKSLQFLKCIDTYFQMEFYQRNFVGKILFLALGGLILQPPMKAISELLTTLRNYIKYFVSYVWRNEKPEKRDDLPEYIDCTFSAWTYQGSDRLWASVIEKIWTNIEAEHGPNSVKEHRASVALSGELNDDNMDIRRKKRKEAIFFLRLKGFLYLSTALGTAVYLGVSGSSFLNFFNDDIYNKIILQLTAISPLIALLFKVLPHIRNPGIQMQNEIDKYSREDFTNEKGFMGRIKKEFELICDYLSIYEKWDEKHQIMRGVRLYIFVDDLDRCSPKTIMDVIRVVHLLLDNDAPITIWIAIDSRVVVAGIEDRMANNPGRFKDEGIDGYEFLEKIVQIPFCLPDLTRESKANYMQKIFEKDELDPIKICDRLAFILHHEVKVPGIESLIKNKDDFSTPLNREEAMKSLPEVMEKMISQGTLQGNEGQQNTSLIRGPQEVLNAVKVRLATNEEVGEQLEEEFLSFLSSGIEEATMNTASGAGGTSPPAFDDQPSSSSSSDDQPTISSNDQPEVAELPPSVVENQETTPIESEAHVNPKKMQYRPLMDALESNWFKKYADHFSGSPRKIKRIINSYMISRYVADKMNLKGPVFREKLLKLTILLEQWPYRMSWMLIMVENMQQQNRIIQNHKNDEKKQERLRKQSLVNLLAKADHNEERTKALTIMDCLDYPLLEVYHLLVQGLMHSPDDAHVQLQRDADPQVFEMLLSEPSESEPSAILKMKDLAPEGAEGTPPDTLRPFTFNIQKHMTDRVQRSFDNCMLHVQSTDGENSRFGAFQKKSNYFERKYDGRLMPPQQSRQDEDT